MKHFTSKLLIVSSIIMILAAMPAFGDDANGPYGTKKGNISEVTIVSGCVISIREFNIDYITLCTNGECSESECKSVITIQGLGPEWYWEEPCIVGFYQDGNVDLDSYVCGADAVALPNEGDSVTIETITNSDGDLVAVWVKTEELQSQDQDLAVLLRNEDEDYNPLWKGTGK
jgi:hypothetical protein